MHEVLRKVSELVFISDVLRGSYISGTKGEVSDGGTGDERVGKCTLVLNNFTDLDLTLLGRNRPNGRRIFECRYARGYLWKEKEMRLRNEAMERNYHVTEEDGLELVETKTQSSGTCCREESALKRPIEPNARENSKRTSNNY